MREARTPAEPVTRYLTMALNILKAMTNRVSLDLQEDGLLALGGLGREITTHIARIRRANRDAA